MNDRHILAFDIGSNSVGSMWFDSREAKIIAGTSIFPAGVDEADDKRGDPKNAKRRMARRTRITLRRRAERKRQLRLRLIAAGLLPANAEEFKALLEASDPWMLRREGLDKPLTPHEFGRVLLHLAQRRGALGLKIVEVDEGDNGAPDADEDGKVKAAIGEVRAKMLAAKTHPSEVMTFGKFIAIERESARRRHPLPGPDPRPKDERKGPREYRDAIRNKAGNYEHCADRAMIRDEFDQLWKSQKRLNGATSKLLTTELRIALDDPDRVLMDNDASKSPDDRQRYKWTFREGGLLFEQRFARWDEGTLGRCVLEPTERCAPHADMFASRYRVVESVNNLTIIERGEARAITPDERTRIIAYLSQPLGVQTKGKLKGKPKAKVTFTDLRARMAEWYGKDRWPHKKDLSPCRFKNEDSDENKDINTDWFSREIIYGAIGVDRWNAMPESLREGVNRAVLSHNPEDEGDAYKLKAGVMKWAGLTEPQADALIAAWTRRPNLDAQRLKMSRRAVRNLLPYMDRFDEQKQHWITQVEARQAHAEALAHQYATALVEKGAPGPEAMKQARERVDVRRYHTGAKGATAKDRHYIAKHVLTKDGHVVKDQGDPNGRALAEPPPAPLISNPVVRKAIHEVRRHLVEYLTTFGRKPDEIYIELAREARMGAKDADRLLFRNRLRNRIRNDIITFFDLDARTPTQQRAAVDRVVLCVQQSGVCPLCGNQRVKTTLSPKAAALGDECEVAHIIPRGSGGHNGLGNVVLAHTKCNRDMGRQTPRQFWSTNLKGGFDEGYRWVEGIYQQVDRPKPSEIKNAKGDALWACYFDWREDKRKIEQFAKDVKDIQDMTQRQEAATKYATRQVMAYLADALYGGKGLPERSTGTGSEGDERRIFATDGMWTGRLRREWGLFFDPHNRKAKGLSNDEEHQRKEKDRGDHRHHAIDAVVIGFCTRSVQSAWEKREKAAEAERDKDGKPRWNTADEEQMDKYRRLHPLDPPAPYKTRDEFREAVRLAVFGDEKNPRPICHRPVKRKLIGALHEETLFGPVLDNAGKPTGNFTAKKSVLALTPNHLRVPDGWDDLESKYHDGRTSPLRKTGILRELAAMDDPPPGKSGIVRDRSLRNQLRKCLQAAKLDPDRFTANEIKRLAESGGFKQASGVPIRSVVLLRTMSDPVVIDRKQADYSTGRMNQDPNPASRRAYLGGNNHHIEVRALKNKKGGEVWSGVIVSAFESSQRKLARLRALRAANIPKPDDFRALPKAERARLRPMLASIERTHALVNRADDERLGGRFIMSLCEGETLWMYRKPDKNSNAKELGYFVVAKLDKPQSVVLVPHWDARAAGERKNAEGKVVTDSARDQFTATPTDLRDLAPPGKPHAIKVRVSPLGVITELERD